MNPDPRLNAYRDDLADERLRGQVDASRYVIGEPAWVIAPQSVVRATRGPRADAVTFCHYGEELRVFETVDNIAWCQSLFDGYVGYIDTFGIEFGPPPSPTHYVATRVCHTYDAPDLRSWNTGWLPRHSAVSVARTGLVTRGTEYAWIDIAGHVPLGCLSEQPPRSTDLVAAAELYLGCPYLWGGRSFFGIDCSGLVQSAFRDLGLTVARDTDMQRDAIGTAVSLATPAELRRGDLIYMPGHVMIYAGDGNVIHADGASMTVRRDDLATLMRERGLAFAGFTVRRP